MDENESIPVLNSNFSVLADLSANFNIAHMNAQSLAQRSHMVELMDILGSGHLHCLLISESWLKSHHSDDTYNIPSKYYIFRADRECGRAGGVAAYVDRRFRLSRLQLSLVSPIDYIFLEVNIKSIKVLVGVVYRPPDVDYKRLSFLEEFLNENFMNYEHIIIMGDLNIDHLVSDHKTRFLRNIINDYGLSLINSLPTHHTLHGSSSLLDLMLTNLQMKLSCYGQCSMPGFSRHDMVYCSINFGERPLIVKQ